MTHTIHVFVDEKKFSTSLAENATTHAFRNLLPLTLNMIELNGNEKYAELPQPLPTDAKNPGTIKTGDILLWGKNTLVIFYKTFTTSYSYTCIGTIDEPKQLAEAVGKGNVMIRFE